MLDLQTDGPAFGANALAALKQADGPLHGLAVEFDHRPYDWNEPAVLVQTVAKSRAVGAIVAASSEGGLFEYGSDEAIVANLRGLSAGGRGELRGRFRDQRKRYPKTDDRGDELQAVSARTRRLGPACCAGRLRHPQERTRRCQRSSSFANALAVEHIGARAEHSAENIFRMVPWRELNPHSLRNTILSRARLPVPPHGHGATFYTPERRSSNEAGLSTRRSLIVSDWRETRGIPVRVPGARVARNPSGENRTSSVKDDVLLRKLLFQ